MSSWYSFKATLICIVALGSISECSSGLLAGTVSVPPGAEAHRLRSKDAGTSLVSVKGELEVNRTSGKIFSVAVVVVHCDEPIKYISQLPGAVPLPFHLTRIHVVEKCCHKGSCETLPNVSGVRGLPPPRVEATFQKNVGLALYGYTEHISMNYNQLEDFTAFLEGDSISTTFDLCDIPGFLQVAYKRGYAGMGFRYGQSNTLGWLQLPSCSGKPVSLGGKSGRTVNVYNGAFLASRSAIHHTPLEAFQRIDACFGSDKDAVPHANLVEVKNHRKIPGFLEGNFFEQSGHLLFGMPLELPDQGIKPCGSRRVKYPSR